MNPPAYEHVALELAFSVSAATASVVNVTVRRDGQNTPDGPEQEQGPLLYRIVQQRTSKLSSPFKPDLEITHVPSGRIVGTVKIRSMSKARVLLFPGSKQAIVYKDSFVSLYGNGDIHWYLAAPSYDGGNATVELRRSDKHRSPLCRVVVHGGLGTKKGTIDVMNYRNEQQALDEIMVSTAAEIWDPNGKGQGENYHQDTVPKRQVVYRTMSVYDEVERGGYSGRLASP